MPTCAQHHRAAFLVGGAAAPVSHPDIDPCAISFKFVSRIGEDGLESFSFSGPAVGACFVDAVGRVRGRMMVSAAGWYR
jgi:hypothetical protein